MIKSLLCPTLLASLLALTSAQVAFKGTCSDKVRVVDNFSVEKYLGKWFQYANYPAAFQANGKCVIAEYSLDKDGLVDVKNSMVNEKTNEVSDIVGNASVVASGKLLVKFPVSTAVTVSSNYWVLDTDYENYSVVYACSPKSENEHYVSVWILTRQALPEPKFIKNAVQVLKNNNISLNELQITNQISCNEC